MAGFLIVRDGADGGLEYRSCGTHSSKTGGAWRPTTANTQPKDAARWTSAATAEKALAILNAAEPDITARVLEITPSHPRAAKAETPAEPTAIKPKGRRGGRAKREPVGAAEAAVA